jgi:hypothetical protein
MIRRLVLLALAVLLGAAGAQADITWSFSYVYLTGPTPAAQGSGFFTTGTAYADGWLPVTSIIGNTNLGAITGLETSGGTGVDPGTLGRFDYCCETYPPNWDYYYDNVFSPTGPNPFSATGGLLFDVGSGIGSDGIPYSPVLLWGDGQGNTYEISYGEELPGYGLLADGGNTVVFKVTRVPEAGFYEGFALCMGGLLFAYRRLRRS